MLNPLLLPAILAASYGYVAMRKGKSQLITWLKDANNAALSHFKAITEDMTTVLQTSVPFDYQDFLQENLDEAKRQRDAASAAALKAQTERDEQRGKLYDTRQRAGGLLRRAEEAIEALRIAEAEAHA